MYKKEIIREALRQTELQLEDLQTIASSVESRAFQFAGTCILVATFGIGFKDSVENPFALKLAAMGLIFSAFWALFSVSPRRFHIRGHRWEGWKGHLDDFDSVEYALQSQAEENDQRIKENFACLERSAVMFRVSFCTALISISVYFLGHL